MKKWFKRFKNQKGMTLVELLAVVVILGIVAAIAVPSINGIIENSKKDAHKSNALLIINSVKLGITTGQLPDSNSDITLNQLVQNGLLDSVPSDPSNKGKAYHSTESKVTYVAPQMENGKVKTPATFSITLVDSNGKYYYLSQTEQTLNSGTAKLELPAKATP